MGRPKLCRLSGGKRKFASHESALQRIGELELTGITAYQCPECGSWHMTSHGKLDKPSALPVLNRMQKLRCDRIIREERVRAAMRHEGPTKLAHYHD